MREKIFQVVYVDMAEHIRVIYEDKDEQTVEKFANHYDGAQKDVFVKTVYRMPGVRDYHDMKTPGSEL